MERLTEKTKDGIAYTRIPLNRSSIFDENDNRIECYTGYIADKLANYEDVEEQCRLIKLPFEIGSNVWLLYDNRDSKEIEEVKITDFMALSHLYRLYFSNGSCYTVAKGQEWKYLFSTREEAEKALKDLEDK